MGPGPTAPDDAPADLVRLLPGARVLVLLAVLALATIACGSTVAVQVAGAAGTGTAATTGTGGSAPAGTGGSAPAGTGGGGSAGAPPCTTTTTSEPHCLLAQARGAVGGVASAGDIATDPITGDLLVVGSYNGALDLGDGPLPAITPVSLPSGEGGLGLFVARYDAEGNPKWSRGVANAEAKWAGFSGPDILVAGSFSGDVDFGCGTLHTGDWGQAMAMKLDGGDGSCIWSVPVGVADPNQPIQASGAAIDAAGDLVVTGAYFGMEGFVTKRRGSDGDEVWTRTLSGAGSWHMRQGNAVAIDASGAVYFGCSLRWPTPFAGSTLMPINDAQEALLLKYDGDGHELWARQYGSPNGLSYVSSVVVGPDQKVWLTGLYAVSITIGAQTFASTHDDTQGFVAAVTPDGDVTAATAVTDGWVIDGSYITLAPTGAPVVAFAFNDQITLGGSMLTPPMSAGILVAELDPCNALAPVWWSAPYDGDMYDVFAVHTDPSGNLLLAGTTASTLDLGCGLLTPSGYGDLWYARLGP